MANDKKKTKNLTLNQARQLIALTSSIVSRASLGSVLGYSYGTKRDIYEAMGYKKEPVYDDYNARYKRQDIASRIIDAFVSATWRKKPVIEESGDETDTEFEKKWRELIKERNITKSM